jgi:hypothetical protein
LGNLDDDDDDDDDVDISTVWENTSITEHMKPSAIGSVGDCEMKKHKPRLDKCSELLGERKQVKLHWMQNQSKGNRFNANNVRSETSRTFRNKNS